MDPQDVDIGGGCRRIEGTQQDTRQGHTVLDAMETTNPFRGERTTFFERTFDLACPEMPTSFHFRVTFPRTFGPVAESFVSVGRTDRSAGLVHVILVLTVCRGGEREVFMKYRVSGLGPGRYDKDIGRIALHLDFMRESRLRLEFSITVKGCHGMERESMDLEDSDLPAPKKRRLVCQRDD